MPWPKQLRDMNCVEALEALKEGLEAISNAGRLPEISLLNLFIDHAIMAHKDEMHKEYKRGVDSIRLSPDYVGAIGGFSND